jgi:hypothetical protein
VIAPTRIKPAVRPLEPSGPWRTVAEFGGRPLRIAPAPGGATCIDFRRADGIGVAPVPRTPAPLMPTPAQDSAGCNPPSNRLSGWLVRIAPAGKLGHLVLVGHLPRGATGLEARFAKHPLRARVVRGVYFAELPQRPGRTLTRLVALGPDGRPTTSLRLQLPPTGVFQPAWHGALYTMVALGPYNSKGYYVGRLIWPDGHLTPR